MQHVFAVSSALSLAAMAERVGALGLAPEAVALIVVPREPVLEAVEPLDARPGLAASVALAGRVVHLEALTAPAHPLAFAPAPDSHHERLAHEQLATALGLDESAPHTLWIETTTLPGRTLARLLPHAQVRVLSTGLAGYGPSSGHLDDTVAHRVVAVHQLDLLPGVAPQLLAERDVPCEPLAVEAVLPQVAQARARREPDAGASAPLGDPVVLVVAHDLADQGVLTEAEHGELLDAMVAAALDAAPGVGATAVLVRPHPRAVESEVLRVIERHAAAGHDVRLAPPAALAEQLYAELAVRQVVGCFSTALFTARAAGIPVLAVGTRWVLAHISPYTNPDRVALALSDLVLPSTQKDGAAEPGDDDPALTRLVLGLMSLAMQPAVAARLHGVFDAELHERGDAGRWTVRHYVAKARLDELVPPPATSQDDAPRTLAERIGRRLRGS